MKNAETLTLELNACAVEHAELIARAARVDSDYVTYMFTIKAISGKTELLKIAKAAAVEAMGIDHTLKPVNGNFSVSALQEAIINHYAEILGVESTHQRIAELKERMSDLQAAIANVDRIAMFESVLGDTEQASIFETLNGLCFELYAMDRADMAREVIDLVLRHSYRNEIAVYDAVEPYVRTIADFRAAYAEPAAEAPAEVPAPVAKSSKK